MTENQVESIVDELTREQTRLRDRLTVVKGELAKIEAALIRVNGALDALRGSGKRKTMRRPAATKQDVIKFTEAVLGEGKLFSRDKLKEEVEQRVLASGKSRMGFALRFKEALAEPQFVETPEGFHLDDGHAPALVLA